MFNRFFGDSVSQWVSIGVAIFVIFLLLVLFSYVIRRLMAGRRRVSSSNRGRQPRLGVVDVFDLDGQRQLVLVRRDNIEHLVMIGGPSDVVVESGIVRSSRAAAVGDAVADRLEAELQAAPPVRAAEPARPPAPAAPMPAARPLPAPATKLPPAPPLRTTPAASPAAPPVPLPPGRPPLPAAPAPPTPPAPARPAQAAPPSAPPPAAKSPPMPDGSAAARQIEEALKRPQSPPPPRPPAPAPPPPPGAPARSPAPPPPPAPPPRPAAAPAASPALPPPPAKPSGDGKAATEPKPIADAKQVGSPGLDINALEEEMARLLGRPSKN